MCDIPIIFSAPMVLALLAGRKTQTRRLAWRDPIPVPADAADYWRGRGARVSFPDDTDTCIAWLRSPWQKVRPGDRLWVRESLSAVEERAANGAPKGMWLYYAADGVPVPGNRPGHKGVPSIHMPRWASRLTLTVTDVRVQRLQEISADDAEAEGLWRGRGRRHLFWLNATACRLLDGQSHKAVFRDLWNSLHGPDAWDANPEVVALTFTVKQRNIDA